MVRADTQAFQSNSDTVLSPLPHDAADFLHALLCTFQHDMTTLLDPLFRSSNTSHLQEHRTSLWKMFRVEYSTVSALVYRRSPKAADLTKYAPSLSEYSNWLLDLPFDVSPWAC